LNEGYSVQLKHDQNEEGSGWVEISLLRKGTEEAEGGAEEEIGLGDILVRSEDVQHNRNYYDKEEMLENMASDAIQQIVNQRAAARVKEEKEEGAPSSSS